MNQNSMAEESPVNVDIVLNSTALSFDYPEDNLLPGGFVDNEIPSNYDHLMSPSDLFPWNDLQYDEIPSIHEFLSNSSFDLPKNICPPPPQHVIPSVSPSVVFKLEPHISLSFINPPESFYHVRYLSEITDSPPNGNVVNTRTKTKKNTSGRYLKGTYARHITIALPSILSDLSDHSNLFIRVTRLTVPYQGISFIHPYPLLYLTPTKKKHSHVIIYGSSICYKITKEEIYSCSKQFPNMTLTRRKQSQLKQMNNLIAFDNNDRQSYPFLGNNAKEKIAMYQLKKSHLDFRLVMRCEQTGEFRNTDAFCRSTELLEAEALDCRRSLNV